MGKYANKYIPNIIKKSPIYLNQIGWEMRTTDYLGEFRYKNDQFEIIFDDKTVLVLGQSGTIINENYTVDATNSYTIQAGDTIEFNSNTNVNIIGGDEINLTSINNVNITGDQVVLTADGLSITWDGSRLETDTETVAYLSDIPALPANITTQGNIFNGASQLIQADVSGLILTSNLPTIPDGNLSSNVTLQGNSFNGNSQLVQLTAGGILPVLDGSLLTNLPSGGSGGTIQNPNLSIQLADEGVVAGNARGVNAIDLGGVRSAATQVASATESILIGSRSLASGTNGVSIGADVINAAPEGICIGNNITISTTGTSDTPILIGKNIDDGVNPTGGNKIYIGNNITNSSANDSGSFSLGNDITLTADFTIDIGNNIESRNDHTVTIKPGNGDNDPSKVFILKETVISNSASEVIIQLQIPQYHSFVGTIGLIGRDTNTTIRNDTVLYRKYSVITVTSAATPVIKQFAELTNYAYTADAVQGIIAITAASSVINFEIQDTTAVSTTLAYNVILEGILTRDY